MEKGKVLVVDDSEIVRESVAMTLEDAGYTVVAPELTLIVGSVILREKPDLVLLDIAMPTLTGEDVMKLVRRHPSIAHTLVVFYSDRPVAELEAATRAAGTAGYIQKGPLHRLVGQVEAWLGANTGPMSRRSLGRWVDEDHCPYDAGCGIFASLSLAGAASFWRQQYCDTRRHQDCARFRMEQQGLVAPADLMPNGTRLGRGRRQASGA